MRKGVILVVALLTAAGSVAAGYLGVKQAGESRLRGTLNSLAAGAVPAANLQYGRIAFEPLARRATVDDIVVSWQGADLEIARAVLDDVGFGSFDPRHGRIEFRGVTDRGFVPGLIASLAGAANGKHVTPREGAWPAFGYDLALEYDFDPASRALSIGKLAWSAPDWGDVSLTLDLLHLPEPLHLPVIEPAAPVQEPVAVMQAVLAQLAEMKSALVGRAALAYRDHGAFNRLLDATAAPGDPQLYFLDLRDALKDKVVSGEAAVWEQAMLEMLRGKADLDLTATPQSPVPLARVLALPGDAVATTAALGLKMATTGSRDLGHFAITEAEARILRAQPHIEAGQQSLGRPGIDEKFAALAAFEQALALAPAEPRATAGAAKAIAALLDAAQQREQERDFFGDAGAVAIYQEILRRAPDCAEARSALATVPQHVAEAALWASGTGTFAGVEMAYDWLSEAGARFPQDPAIQNAREIVADRLVERGTFLAGLGDLVPEGRRSGALAYYVRALEIKPDSPGALQALDALGERVKQAVADEILAGDKAGASARIEAVKAQWPGVPGKTWLEAQLAALLAPPVPKGPVVVYNWSDYIGEFTNARFRQKTGIAVQYEVFDSNETLEARLLARNSGYDVVVPGGAFLARQIPAGLFRKLDKSRLPNLVNLDPALMKATEAFDPGHQYSVPYMWGTIGIGYNLAAVRKRMPDAPVDSWRMVLDPKVVSKFKDCGVAIVDAPDDVLRAVLIYLGLDVNTASPDDYAAAQRTLAAIRPFVRYFHASRYINDIANGQVCLAIGWNGDFAIAQSRAQQARSRIKLRYVVPKEGTLIWVDSLAIPADAPHPNAALAYIDYLLDPQVAANNANYVRYASPNKAAVDRGLINAADLNDPALYPPRPVMERLAGDSPASPELDGLQTRIWAAVKTGE